MRGGPLHEERRMLSREWMDREISVGVVWKVMKKITEKNLDTLVPVLFIQLIYNELQHSIEFRDSAGINSQSIDIEAESGIVQRHSSVRETRTSLAQALTDAAQLPLSIQQQQVCRWKHSVLFYRRDHIDAEYEEFIGWAKR